MSEEQWANESDGSEISSGFFLCPLRAHVKARRKKHWRGKRNGQPEQRNICPQKQAQQLLPAPYRVCVLIHLVDNCTKCEMPCCTVSSITNLVIIPTLSHWRVSGDDPSAANWRAARSTARHNIRAATRELDLLGGHWPSSLAVVATSSTVRPRVSTNSNAVPAPTRTPRHRVRSAPKKRCIREAWPDPPDPTSQFSSGTFMKIARWKKGSTIPLRRGRSLAFRAIGSFRSLTVGSVHTKPSACYD